jgi:hypothetical protein
VIVVTPFCVTVPKTAPSETPLGLCALSVKMRPRVAHTSLLLACVGSFRNFRQAITQHLKSPFVTQICT